MQTTENILPFDNDDVLKDHELLTELIKAIVSCPERVEIVSTKAPEATVLTIYVADEDRGHVIGREKRTISAIEHLFSKVSFMSKEKRKVHVQLGGQVKPNPRKSRRREN